MNNQNPIVSVTLWFKRPNKQNIFKLCELKQNINLRKNKWRLTLNVKQIIVTFETKNHIRALIVKQYLLS
jgi:hypothetical protein